MVEVDKKVLSEIKEELVVSLEEARNLVRGIRISTDKVQKLLELE